MREFVDQHRRELVEDAGDKPKRVVVKKTQPKKKSFLARKAKIVKRKEVVDDDSPDITQTPKFKLLELMRELDDDDGISPVELVTKAEASGIPRPRLQMNKMIRRGILYIHEGKIHVT